MTGLDESVDHRENPFGLVRSSPNTCDTSFRIATSSSSCEDRFLRLRQFDALRRGDPRALAPVDLVLAVPVMDRDGPVDSRH
jgi:hypothetical protein